MMLGKFCEIPGNFHNILEFCRWPEVIGHEKKNLTSLSQDKFTGYCRKFKGK